MLQYVEDVNRYDKRIKHTQEPDRTILVMAGPLEIAHIVEDRNTPHSMPKNIYRAIVLDLGWYSRENKITRWDHLGRYPSVAQARHAVDAWYEENKQELYDKGDPRVNPRYITAGDNPEFFPTPQALAGKMLAGVDWKRVGLVLEPSAGKGDLADCMNALLCKSRKLGRYGSIPVDVIEPDPNLQHILLGKKYRLIGDDFLTLATRKVYDLILMNPPFSNGDEHLLKAISMIQNSGGQIVCLLNAETIRNPYTNRRKVLAQKLQEFNAKIEFVKDAFRHAERRSDVEVAIVTIKKDRPRTQSFIWNGLKMAREVRIRESDANALVSGNWAEQMLAGFEMEADAGLKLMEEYAAIAPYIMTSNSKYAKPIIRLDVADHGSVGKLTNSVVNDYLRVLRTKYWCALLDRDEIKAKMTSAMQEDYRSKLNELADYDFTKFNVMRFMSEIRNQLQQGVVDSLHTLFKKLSEEHSWYPECSKNIHYYNGWKTNEAHKVGMKAIIPVHGCFADSWSRDFLDTYQIYGIISDLERALNYLNKGQVEWHENIEMQIRRANDKQSNKIHFTYFDATFYKKGTCHLKFHEEAKPLIDRLNIMVARDKNWLPPCYGKVSYEEMDDESRAVVDDFQGREEYQKVCADAGYYLGGADSNFMALPGVVA